MKKNKLHEFAIGSVDLIVKKNKILSIIKFKILPKKLNLKNL